MEKIKFTRVGAIGVFVSIVALALGALSYAVYHNGNYSAQSQNNHNYCPPPDYTDGAFPPAVQSASNSAFGGTTAMVSSQSTVAELTNILNIQKAEASGDTQLAESANVPTTLQNQLSSIVANSTYFTNTIALLKNPASFF